MIFLIFDFLLKNGININEPQKDGSTSLHGAAFYNQEIIVQLFLEYGAKQI
jgi:ankyrin repeat protein